jgi:protein-L-isoaspartate(D-aspartate) O-methyltransferase
MRTLGLVGLAVVVAAVVASYNYLRADGAAAPDFAKLREQMVELLVRQGYVSSKPVIEALRSVERHLFVPEVYRSLAYEDTPLPIGYEQTISAPSIVAMMTELLEPRPEHIVLEVGTGSGYQAAVLAKLVKHVYTIEIIKELAESARKRLAELGFKNVTVRCGDGYRGWPEHAPFDGIIVTCAPTDIPPPLIEQLKEGGRMVIPVGEPWAQELYVLRKEKGQIIKKAVIAVAFVPMTGEVQTRR